MRSALVVAAFVLVCACRTSPRAPVRAPEALGSETEGVAERAPSACAFGSLDALCAGFREHLAAGGDGAPAGEGCRYAERRVVDGPFGEVVVVEPAVGEAPPSIDARPTTRVLAARIGSRWFPLWVFESEPATGGPGGPRFEWSLDPSGALVTWTRVDGILDREDPYGYGQVDRTVVATARGVPMIAATATIERWRGEVDEGCTRACNAESPRPPYPGCARRCGSMVRSTRSWTRTERAVVVGATETRVEGRPRDGAPPEAASPAETRRLDVPDGWLGLCGFMPVTRAPVSAEPPSDPEAAAARERAREALARGAFTEVPGSREAVGAGAVTAIIELSDGGGGGCGGGGCSYAVRVRAVDGAFPEEGLRYFAGDRGDEAGCAPDLLPGAGESRLVEVAPVLEGATVACGLAGYDGRSTRTWAILRVFAPR